MFQNRKLSDYKETFTYLMCTDLQCPGACYGSNSSAGFPEAWSGDLSCLLGLVGVASDVSGVAVSGEKADLRANWARR